MSPNMFEVTITWNCARVAHELQREVVHVEVARLDLRVLGRHRLEDALPQVVGVDQHVRLVRHHHLRAAAWPRANSKAWRTMRSTPLRVLRSISVATSSGVSFLKLPPIIT